MKTKTPKNDDVKVVRTRTVKISDTIHHRIRVLSVQKRVPMQDFIETLLLFGLREKAYDKSVEAEAAA